MAWQLKSLIDIWAIIAHESIFTCTDALITKRVEDEMSHSIQCPGFNAAGMAAGIKKRQGFDLGLIYSRQPATVAGVFTRNQVQAAPVVLTRTRVADGCARAVIVNSGNANCCTGSQGADDARHMADFVAAGLDLAPEQVLVASTGVIGQPLPLKKIESAGPQLVGALRPDGFEDFAHAIMTTDTVPKLVRRQAEIDGRPFTLLAIAKGAGMIRPDMATMLCFVCSDVAISPAILQQSLQKAVDRSLNCITIDGDTSTNDMVLVMANGVSGATVETTGQQKIFQQLLDELLLDVARRLVKDGEGVTKVVEIKVQGAATREAAFCVADAVAHSPLVKTAFFGEDANWGRIMGAVGRAGVPVDADKIDICFDQVKMVHQGQGCGPDAEAQATRVLQQAEFSVTIDLHQGQGEAAILTCDFSIDYVKINADYRS
jgi:glutamate N-acetyltransferase / amino-acid N-acetyltransferase